MFFENTIKHQLWLPQISLIFDEGSGVLGGSMKCPHVKRCTSSLNSTPIWTQMQPSLHCIGPCSRRVSRVENGLSDLRISWSRSFQPLHWQVLWHALTTTPDMPTSTTQSVFNFHNSNFIKNPNDILSIHTGPLALSVGPRFPQSCNLVRTVLCVVALKLPRFFVRGWIAPGFWLEDLLGGSSQFVSG